MYFLYSLALFALLLLSLPWWVLRMVREGKYRTGLRERLGRVPDRLQATGATGSIWIHAVSVGEWMAVSQLVSRLQANYPGTPIFVSTTTATSQDLARRSLGDGHVFFFPLDFKFAIRPYLDALQPQLLILVETEFWPNLLHLCKQRKMAIAVVNARISDRSFPRYRRWGWFFRRVLRHVDLFLAQSEEDARRLRQIGAPAGRIRTTGNLKFDLDLTLETDIVAKLRSRIHANSPVIVCGSTAENEEQLLLQAFKQVLDQHPDALLILAPRHPHRFNAVADLVSSSMIGPLCRRSSWKSDSGGCEHGAYLRGVFLLDSVGELSSVYALADIAFVGGSLVPGGGHNILEPALHGVAVMTGPYTFNFRDITAMFSREGGLKVVNGGNLAQELLRLLNNEPERRSMGHRARELFALHAGATARTVQALQELISVPGRSPS